MHVCSHCGVAYSSRAAVKRHIVQQRPEIDQLAAPNFSKLADSADGLPKCKHCEKCFQTWQLLQRHIQGGYCSAHPAEDSSAGHTLSAEQGPKVVAGLRVIRTCALLSRHIRPMPSFMSKNVTCMCSAVSCVVSG